MEGARRRARRALALYERRLAPDHPLVSEARTRLASLESLESLEPSESSEPSGGEGEGRGSGAR